MGNFLVDSAPARAKIDFMSRSLRLIRVILDIPSDHPDELILEKRVMKAIAERMNLSNLKAKLIDIFKFKMAGTPHREEVYKTTNMCDHSETALLDVKAN